MGSKTSPTAYFWSKIGEVLNILIPVCITENKIERAMENPCQVMGISEAGIDKRCNACFIKIFKGLPVTLSVNLDCDYPYLLFLRQPRLARLLNDQSKSQPQECF